MALIRLETQDGLAVVDAADIEFVYELLESANFGPWTRTGKMVVSVVIQELQLPMTTAGFREVIDAMRKAGRHVHVFTRELDALAAFAWEAVVGLKQYTDGTVCINFTGGTVALSPWGLDETERRWRAFKAGELPR